MRENQEAIRFAYYVTGHGLGHATRVVEVCKFLLKQGHSVTLNTAAPHGFFASQLPSKALEMRYLLLDCGAFQLDAFTVDMQKSLEEYNRVAADGRDQKLAEEATWLRQHEIDLVVSDVVPLACAAAARAGLPSVCVSNFSWDFVYSEYLTAVGARFRKLVWQIAEDYANADLLLRLPGYCPMPAFREIVDIPLVVRLARKSRAEVCEELGISEATKILVFIYGGQPSGEWALKAESLPAGWICLICSNGKFPGGKELPANFRLADKEAYTPDLIGAASCILGKIGYGTVSESLAHGKPFVFVRRDFFNEEPFLRKQLEIYGLAVEIKRRDFREGNWRAFIQHAATLESSFRLPTNGAEVAAELLEDLAYERRRAAAEGGHPGLQRRQSLALQRSGNFSGSLRLRDAVVYGYIMQRHALQETVEVPEWYTRGALPAAPCLERKQGRPSAALEFDVLEGDASVLTECNDTRAFLALVAQLDRRPSSQASAAEELPEQRAARGLFRPEDGIWVCRAPGRLDVMGGIADYSGSLVLQLPITQACHVAAQTHPPDADLKLWTHIRDRHAAAGCERRPVLRIVSLNADSTNRGHAFDMDLNELQKDGRPLPYPDARKNFQLDPSQSWAAYVAGALLVLMHETQGRFDDSLSLLISSDVPDGKGVSSSAALEVAAMSAIAAAYGIELEPFQLAVLCQKVENLVVGAPCGIMDQMASVLGVGDSLLALQCQPAEVLPPVTIPKHLRFWGVDSGVRHSVGGQDYGTVRTAAFMGLKILSTLALSSTKPQAKNHASVSAGKEPQPLGKGYLANLEPGLFRQLYEQKLPEMMTGKQFLEEYGSHWDSATEVQLDVEYPVLQATLHPIHENFRVEAFEAALKSESRQWQCKVLGSLMYQATDRLVELVRREVDIQIREQKQPSLYGAKITGGGSGGTVCVLGRNDAEGEAALARVVEQYGRETGGFSPAVFEGSSMGAAAFGKLKVQMKPSAPSPTFSGIAV